MKKIVHRSTCPVARTLDLVGDRWTLVVIRDLVLGKECFDEFKASGEGIATNILAARLRMLTGYGFVAKFPDPEDARRTRYRLTERGEPLRELLGAVARWGAEHVEGSRKPPFVARAKA